MSVKTLLGYNHLVNSDIMADFSQDIDKNVGMYLHTKKEIYGYFT